MACLFKLQMLTDAGYLFIGLRYGDIEQQFDIGFKHYFETELASLEQMERDQLLIRDEDGLRVLPKGKLLIRNICMQFDFYQREKDRTAFSKLI